MWAVWACVDPKLDSEAAKPDSDSAGVTDTEPDDSADTATTADTDTASETGDTTLPVRWPPAFTTCDPLHDLGAAAPYDTVLVASPTVSGSDMWFTTKGDDGVHRVGHATLSADGMSVEETSPGFGPEAIVDGALLDAAGPMVIEIDGTRQVFFDAHGGAGQEIWRCTLDDATSVSDCVKLLGPADAGDVGELGLQLPHVLRLGDVWHAWMIGVDDIEERRILHSTSEDGLTWTLPILAFDLGVLGEVDLGSHYDPFVMPEPDGTWTLLYAGLGDGEVYTGKRIIAARSTDLFTWTDHTVVLEPGCEGAWDSHRVDGPWVNISEEGVRTLYYDGFDDAETELGARRLLVARE